MSIYNVSVAIRGTAPILQHSFTENHLRELAERAKKVTGAQDYTYEWLSHMYISNCDGQDYISQPASHIESSMIEAAKSFKISGKGNKTYKDFVRAYVYVSPEQILHMRDGHYVPVPDETLMDTPRDGLSVNVMRVTIQRSAVPRARLQIDAGWILRFGIQVIDDQLQPDVLEVILAEAGRAKGLSDYRPRYGRFEVIEWDVTYD